MQTNPVSQAGSQNNAPVVSLLDELIEVSLALPLVAEEELPVPVLVAVEPTLEPAVSVAVAVAVPTVAELSPALSSPQARAAHAHRRSKLSFASGTEFIADDHREAHE